MISKLKNPKNAVLNVHVPPYKSGLDEVLELDMTCVPCWQGNRRRPVRRFGRRLKKYTLLGLHGHIHEGAGR
ncbi:MAG: hypothetical protein U0X93_08270 [Anaerolineales bacterium]